MSVFNGDNDTFSTRLCWVLEGELHKTLSTVAHKQQTPREVVIVTNGQTPSGSVRLWANPGGSELFLEAGESQVAEWAVMGFWDVGAGMFINNNKWRTIHLRGWARSSERLTSNVGLTSWLPLCHFGSFCSDMILWKMGTQRPNSDLRCSCVTWAFTGISFFFLSFLILIGSSVSVKLPGRLRGMSTFKNYRKRRWSTRGQTYYQYKGFAVYHYCLSFLGISLWRFVFGTSSLLPF